MKSLLEQIYFSEVIPNTSAVPDSPEYNRLTERVFEREEHFHEILEGGERVAFQNYMDDMSQRTCITADENFVNGFRLGVRILLEALEQAK